MNKPTPNGKPAMFSATAPSNIAFLKYWGKRDVALQWPANDSISMTLSASRTITTARRTSSPFDSFTFINNLPQSPASNANVDHPLQASGGMQAASSLDPRLLGRELIGNERTMTSVTHPDDKIFRHVNLIRKNLGLTGSLEIFSQNTFPTGCGIASSASGFAALTLASAAALTGEVDWDNLAAHGATRQNLSHWARMGSGSAGRSLFGGFVLWAAGDSHTSQTITSQLPQDHWDLADVIVVLSDSPKHTSSSEAHLAAWASPMFAPRLAGIPGRLKDITKAIRDRDLATLGREIEVDAMEMHAVAMTGTPTINYFSQETVRFISWVRIERQAGRFPAWFTIDAGPNVHLICRREDSRDIAAHIKNHWQNTRLIMDRIGSGPVIEAADFEENNLAQHGAHCDRDFMESHNV